MSFILATNVVASQPPERRPTGTPHARAKSPALVHQWTVQSPIIGPYNFLTFWGLLDLHGPQIDYDMDPEMPIKFPLIIILPRTLDNGKA